MAKKWYLSKTLWATVALFASETILLATQVLPLSVEVITILNFINGTVMIALRFLTSQPLKV